MARKTYCTSDPLSPGGPTGPCRQKRHSNQNTLNSHPPLAAQGGSCIQALFSALCCVLHSWVWVICTACAHGQSMLSLTPGWVWRHRTTAPTHLLGWDRTSLPGSEEHYIQLPLTQEKTSHRTSVLFDLGQSRGPVGLCMLFVWGCNLKMCSWVERVTGRYPLL